MKRKLGQAVLILLAFVFLLGTANGCSKANNNTSKGTVEVTFWQPDLATWQPAYKKLVDQFEKDHADIKVKMVNFPEEGYNEKLNTTFAANQGPDIWVNMDTSQHAYAKGYIQPLDEFINRDKVNMDQYFPNVKMNVTGKDGKIYGLPRDDSPTFIIYNKDLFDKYHIVYPKDSWTWDDFRTDAKELTHPADKIYGTDAMSDTWTMLYGEPWLWDMGANVISDDGTKAVGYLDSEGVIKVAQFAQNVAKDGSQVPSSLSDSFSGDFGGFTTGKIGMSAGSLWGYETLSEVKFNWGAVKLPMPPEVADTYSFWTAALYAMNAKSKHPNEAWEFLKFLGSEQAGDIVIQNGKIWTPAVKNCWIKAGWDKDEHLSFAYYLGEKQTKNFCVNLSANFYNEYAPVDDAWKSIVDPVKGQNYADPATALKKAAHEVQANLDKNNQ